jgi:hypothetical protein
MWDLVLNGGYELQTKLKKWLKNVNFYIETELLESRTLGVKALKKLIYATS